MRSTPALHCWRPARLHALVGRRCCACGRSRSQCSYSVMQLDLLADLASHIRFFFSPSRQGVAPARGAGHTLAGGAHPVTDEFHASVGPSCPSALVRQVVPTYKAAQPGTTATTRGPQVANLGTRLLAPHPLRPRPEVAMDTHSNSGTLVPATRCHRAPFG